MAMMAASYFASSSSTTVPPTALRPEAPFREPPPHPPRPPALQLSSSTQLTSTFLSTSTVSSASSFVAAKPFSLVAGIPCVDPCGAQLRQAGDGPPSIAAEFSEPTIGVLLAREETSASPSSSFLQVISGERVPSGDGLLPSPICSFMHPISLPFLSHTTSILAPIVTPSPSQVLVASSPQSIGVGIGDGSEPLSIQEGGENVSTSELPLTTQNLVDLPPSPPQGTQPKHLPRPHQDCIPRPHQDCIMSDEDMDNDDLLHDPPLPASAEEQVTFGSFAAPVCPLIPGAPHPGGWNLGKNMVAFFVGHLLN